MSQVSIITFSLRIRTELDLASVAERVEHVLGIRLVPYRGDRFEGPTLEATVLGVWVVLTVVHSVQDDAPNRYQLQGRQPSTDSAIATALHEIDDYVLRLLERDNPGAWYRPSKEEVSIDLGLFSGRVQDIEPGEAVGAFRILPPAGAG